jgi:pimeloyl-ACP methyl ester carboxylesterase
MTGIAFGPETSEPDVVFAHATGFNALTYRAMLAPLGQRYHVLAIDLRGHGRTLLPTRRFGYTSWRIHADDLTALIERHFTRAVTLAGHSLGATVSLLAAAARPDLTASLAMIEPVILPARAYSLFRAPLGPSFVRRAMPLSRAAAKRRNSFADRQSAAAAFAGRSVFKAFSRDMLEDYLLDGLIEDGAGALKLACAPAYEAATFAAQRHDPWAALKRVNCPIVLLRASRDSTVRDSAYRKLAALKPEARLAIVEGGHMLPMERPDRVRAAIETAMLIARGGAA